MAAIDSKVCETVQRGVDRRFDVVDKRLNDHDEDITDLKIIVAKLTQIQETTQEHMTSFWLTQQGKWVIVGGVLILIMLTAAAIGQHALSDYITSFVKNQGLPSLQ